MYFSMDFAKFFEKSFLYRAPPVVAPASILSLFFKIQIGIVADPCPSITLIPLGFEFQNQMIK